jgi:hypothetical protein
MGRRTTSTAGYKAKIGILSQMNADKVTRTGTATSRGEKGEL